MLNFQSSILNCGILSTFPVLNNCHMNQQKIIKIGTIIYALVIAFFGINHFLSGTGLQNTVPRFIPGGIFWVYITGVALIAASIAILIGKYDFAAAIGISIFLFTIVLTVHVPAVVNAPDDRAMRFPITNLMKDTAMGAAALIIAGLSRLKLA